MTDIVNVIIRTGQSNSWGNNPGGPGQSLAAVRYWDSYNTVKDSSAWHDLDDTHGSDFELGKALNAAGYKVAILNVGQGATASSDWVSPDATFTWAVAELTQALAALAAEYTAGTQFRYWHIRNQGEAEALFSSQPAVEQWSDNTASWQTALEGIVGCKLETVVCGTNSGLVGHTFPGVLEAEQLGFAGDAQHYLDQSDGYTWDDASQLHMNQAGYVAYGQALGARMLELFAALGGISLALRNKLLDHARNVAAYSPPATVYYGLRIAGVEVTGTGYARVAKTNNTTNFPAAASRNKQLATLLTFPVAGADWGLVDEVVEYDVSSGGTSANIRASWKVPNPKPVNNTGTLTIPIGGFQVTFAAGNFTDGVVHSLLDLAWGGSAYAAPATVYGSYWQGDPLSGGTQQGSRVAITQATTWGAASAGGSATVADITLAPQALATHWAEHTLSSGGTLLYTGTVSTPPSSGTIAAGSLTTSLTNG